MQMPQYNFTRPLLHWNELFSEKVLMFILRPSEKTAESYLALKIDQVIISFNYLLKETKNQTIFRIVHLESARVDKLNPQNVATHFGRLRP